MYLRIKTINEVTLTIFDSLLILIMVFGSLLVALLAISSTIQFKIKEAFIFLCTMGNDALLTKKLHRLELEEGEASDGVVSVSNRWPEHLPDDLIEMIVKRLSLIDSLRFSSVLSQRCQRATQIPWILRYVRSVDLTTANYSLYSPSEDSVYSLTFPKETADASYSISCIGSVDGFLIIKEYKFIKLVHLDQIMKVTIYLLNPITGARTMLPPLSENPWISVASSNPTCSDWIVATIIQPTPYKLAFCRPGDKSWTYQLGPRFGIYFRCLQFHKDGKLYAFASSLEFGILYLVVFDPLEVFSQAKSNMYKGKQFEIGSLIRQHKTLPLPSLMISSKGEILLVWNQYIKNECGLLYQLQNANPPFLVCKLDVQTSSEPELIKMDTLEDQTIFMHPSQNTLISIPKAELTNSKLAVQNNEAFNWLGGGNCIYFGKNNTGNYVICIYNLDDGKCTYLSTDNYIDARDEELPRLDYSGVCWLTPKF